MKSILIKLKFIINNIFWLVLKFPEFKLLFNRLSFYDIKLFKFLDWTSHTFYFKANLEEKNIFIKLFKHENKNIREAEVLKYISNSESGALAPKLIYESPIKNKFIIVTEIIEGGILKEKNIDFDFFLLIADQFIEILNSLQKLDVVHCDIRPNNIIITPSKKVKLIDFEFAICKSIQNLNNLNFENKLILQNLGEEYSCEGFIWDDAYSFYRIIKNILEFNEYRESDLYIANEKVDIIKSYIGINTYEI
jgi:serine/threonine protein kinase